MQETKQARFHYKVATFLREPGDGTLTLQKLVTEATKNRKPYTRLHNPQSDGLGFRLLNRPTFHISDDSTKTVLGCEFLEYEKGADQSMIILDPNADEVDLDATPKQEGREYLAGAVYAAIVDNHVVLVQLKASRALDFQNYLNWLLIEKTKVMVPENRIALSDHVPQQKIPIRDVRGIKIHADVPLRPLIEASSDGAEQAAVGEPRESRAITLRPFGAAWDMLKSLFAEGLDLPAISVDDASNAPKIEASIFLSWTPPDRKTDSDDFMSSIAKNMSHVGDEFDYSVQTKTGPIGKETFKLNQPKTFKWGKGRPRFDDIFPKMGIWLAELIEAGKVIP